jgi:hypothetical protein
VASTFLTSTVLAGAFAVAIGLAPAAAAEEADEVSKRDGGRGSSQQAAGSDRGGPYRPGPARKPSRPDAASTIPGWANDAVWARPGPGSPNLFGGLPKPPAFALD